MRQNEMMVGDWLMYHPERIDENDGFEPYPVTVHAVDIEDAELFEPIPLTKEILEKNGYVYYNKPLYLYQHKTLPTIYSDSDNKSFWCRSMEVNYVHRLQNLLRVMREFDEANNIEID